MKQTTPYIIKERKEKKLPTENAQQWYAQAMATQNDQEHKTYRWNSAPDHDSCQQLG